MKSIRSIKIPASPRTMPTILVIALTVLAGASGLAYSSPYSPLLFFGGIVAIWIFIAWLARPVWALYAALVLVFLPLGLIPTSIHSTLNRSITVIAAGMYLIQSLRSRQKIILSGSALLMLCFLAWSSITLLWAENTSPATNTLQVYSLRFLLFLFLIPNEIRTKPALDGLMKTLAFSGWILMPSVVITLLLEGYITGSRLAIFGMNLNDAGVLALITMVGALWQASQPSKNHRKLIALNAKIFILLTFGIVAMTGSRGSALSLMLTLSTFCIWKSTRSWGKTALVITILALIFIPSIFTTLVQRFTVERGDTLLGGREVLWQAAWRLIQDYPMGGVGIGNAPYAVVSYLETDPRMVGAQMVVLHNPLLTIWSETGIPGILLYLGVFMSAVYSFGKQYLKFKTIKNTAPIPYFALVSTVTLGYMISWIKGGGMESDFSYFLILALLTLPSVLDMAGFLAVPPVFQNSTDRG